MRIGSVVVFLSNHCEAQNHISALPDTRTRQIEQHIPFHGYQQETHQEFSEVRQARFKGAGDQGFSPLTAPNTLEYVGCSTISRGSFSNSFPPIISLPVSKS
jgi:hypothetical protein